jgi:hypothetical protein
MANLQETIAILGEYLYTVCPYCGEEHYLNVEMKPEFALSIIKNLLKKQDAHIRHEIALDMRACGGYQQGDIGLVVDKVKWNALIKRLEGEIWMRL